MDINFRWNFTVKVELSPVAAAKLDAILAGLKGLEAQTMSVKQDLKDLTDKLDAATDEIARDLTALRDQVKNSMTDAEVQEVRDNLQTKIDRLTELGKDPADPVPASE